MLEVHRYPKPPPPLTRKIFHPTLNGMLFWHAHTVGHPDLGMTSALPCDEDGHELPLGAPPPPRDDTEDWWPFENRPHFEFANWHYTKVQTSRGDLNEILRNHAAQKVLETGDVHARAPYDSADDMYETIDAVPYGDLPWSTFELKYTGPITPHTPPWKIKTYTIHTRDALAVVESIAGSADFDGRWDYVPYEEYSGPGCRRYADVMSGTWAFKKAVSSSSYLLPCPVVLTQIFRLRTLLPQMIHIMAPCSRRSSWVLIRPQSLLRPATKNSTRCTCPSATSTTRCGVRIVTPWSHSHS